MFIVVFLKRNFLCCVICLQGALANHAKGSCIMGVVARHLNEKNGHSHSFRYAKSWMVLLSSASLLYKQTQLGLLLAHVMVSCATGQLSIISKLAKLQTPIFGYCKKLQNQNRLLVPERKSGTHNQNQKTFVYLGMI